MEILSHKVLFGPNIYLFSPVIEVCIDIGKYDQIESKDVPGFNECLLCYYPGLYEHTCSLGKKGGFVKRLKEGTFFSHILEHLCLEIQSNLGQEVYYGKTIWQKDSEYKIVVEYLVEELAIFAFESAVKLLRNILNNRDIEFIVRKINKDGEEMLCKYGIGPSTKSILEAARKKNVPVIPLDRTSCLYQLGYGNKQRKIEATIASTTSCIAVDIACNKVQTNKIVADAGLPVPKGFIVEKPSELKELIYNLGTPLVVKPYNSNHGKGVSLNINNWYELKESFNCALRYSDKVIVEEFVEGKDYRLLVVGNKLAAAAERIPPFIIGDGKKTIEELINFENRSAERGDGHEKKLTCINIDGMVIKYIREQGFSLNNIPEKGQMVYLRYNGNLSTGGTSKDVTDEVHPINAQLAIRAAQLIGLDIAGVDMIAGDIRVPLSQQNGAIIEINAAPGIRMHHYPREGKTQNVAEDILEYLFPENKGRIPIVSVTGTNGKTTVCRLLAEIFKNLYNNVGLTITGGTYVNDHCIMEGDNTGPLSARILLKEPMVDIAILETARGGILRQGLAYDQSDVGIVINITEDHLGVDGVESLDELINIKSLVIETVKKSGRCVLNADDPLVVNIADRAHAPILYFSRKANNMIISEHCEKGGEAIYLEGNSIVQQKGNKKAVLFEGINDIPITFGGLASHNIENIIAATAATVGLGVNNNVIKKGLMSFNNNFTDNPGRLNIFESIDLKVILDYGHNPAGFKEIFKFMKKIKGKRLVGVVGVPGDRKDGLIVRAGETIARYLDCVYIKEDENLRGREEGEVASLIKKGMLNTGFAGFHKIIADEKEALEEALLNALPGDIIVCFYEKDPEILVQIIKQGIIEFDTRESKIDRIEDKILVID